MVEKTAIPINFQQGLDLKTDPLQLPVGRFAALSNMVFDKIGRLTKRNGFAQITTLPDTSSSYVTTFNGNLTAIGSDIKALAAGPQSWVSVGSFQPVQVNTIPLVRNNNNQTQCDVAISNNNLACVAYTDSVSSASGIANLFKYAIYDYTTGQALVQPTVITPTFGIPKVAPKVFNLNPYFVLVFDGTSGATSHLQYQVISQATLGVVGSSTDMSTSLAISSNSSFDGVVAGGSLFLSWNGAAGAGVKANSLNSFLAKGAEVTIGSTAHRLQVISVCADTSQTSPTIWTSYAVGSSNSLLSVRTVATNNTLNTLFASASVVTGQAVANLASFAINNLATIYYEVSNAYAYDPSVATNLINKKTVAVASVTVSAEQTFSRSIGLGSKAFLLGSQGFVVGAYSSTYQPTCFLLNSSASILARTAYGNGGGYLTSGLPQVSIIGTKAYAGYLFKDLVASVNKGTAVASQTQTAGIYSQTGINLVGYDVTTSRLTTSEIAGNLHLSGGYLSQYDGSQLVENNFHIYPENVTSSISYAGGNVTVGTYYYQATYEWQDNNGNPYRSAPSIPLAVVTTSASATITLNVPTLRLTSKTQNPVKIVLYRWSALQQSYYQITSITQPVLNTKLADFVQVTDALNDNQIIGNNLLYTTGGVVEDDGPHPSKALAQFDTRLWSIDAEDQNVERYSKQVLESTPVEMSDLFSLYISPNTGAQGSTGPMTCHFPMDDKLIQFKENAIYYINGAGPDNTGANSQYSQPIFVTGTVGCSNQNSIVLIPNGLMFQSDKGIWLLGRDLSTQYIGKDVENYNSQTVTSAVVVPGTNQVRFQLSSGVILMFDYFTGQWGTFSGASSISSCLYQDRHTLIDKYGRVFQETPGTYLDGSNPTLLSFETGWISPAGLQGYVRAYRLYLLGEYYTPHRLTVGLAYDYDPSVTQLATLIPQNYAGPWGSDSTWGTITTWGGSSRREQWQINLQNQQCQAIKIFLNEYYDPSVGASPGAGLAISGLKLICGLKGHSPKNMGIAQKKG